MERGVSVDADKYWPVMVELGLHASPSLEGPGEDELPGAWLRDLRQSSGIAPERLCTASVMSEHDSPLSRTTLARIEQGTNRKPIRLGTLNKIAHAFEQCRVPLQASVLWTAWAEWQPESLLPGIGNCRLTHDQPGSISMVSRRHFLSRHARRIR